MIYKTYFLPFGKKKAMLPHPVYLHLLQIYVISSTSLLPCQSAQNYISTHVSITPSSNQMYVHRSIFNLHFSP